MRRKMAGLLIALVLAVLACGLVAGCGDTDAEVASENLSKAAEQFEVERRIVGYNGITDKYLLVVEGLCNIEDERIQLEIVCRVGEDADGKDLFKKNFLGLSDNTSYFVQQLKAENVSTTHYRVIFKPESIIPDFDRP